MKNFLKTVYDLLSHKRTSLFIILFCILAKSLLITFYSYVGKDKIYSLSASYNLLHGKGWTNSFYYLNDIDKEVLEPFCFWPPGYGLLMTPFQKVVGINIFLSTTIFEIICFVFFILLCRAILKTQGLSRAWLNISTVLLSFFSHDFIENSLGTDLLALNFMLGFFYAAVRIWNSTDAGPSRNLGVLAGLCLFLAGFTRYIYVPVCMSIIVALLITSYWKRNKAATKAYFYSFLICFCGLILAMFFQQSACGSPFYTGSDKTGIFFENISYWHPAVIAAFVNLNFIPVQFEKYSHVSYTSWMWIFNWINLGFYLVLLITLSIFFYRKRNLSKNEFPIFIVAGSVLSAAIIGGLALLSLSHSAKYTLTGNAWSFIVEGRYHAFPVVFMQLLFLTIVARSNDLFTFKKIFSGILSLLFLFFLLNSAHQFYYTVKVALNYKEMKDATVREQDYVYFESLLRSTIKENSGKDVLVASSDKYYPLLASMHGQKGIADSYDLDSPIPAVRKPAVLITVIFAPEKDRYVNYLKNREVKLVKEIAAAKIYMQSLAPSPQD